MDFNAIDMSVLNSGVIVMITQWGMRILSALAILIGGWTVGKYLARWVQRIRGLDSTLKSFLGGFLKYGVFVVAFITVLGQFGVQTASLLAVLGAAGLAIGLALQGTLSNVAAGVMLLILRPFNVGDYIEIGTVKGTVRELGLFGTELSTLDNIFIFAPNSKIWNAEIYNFNRNTHRRVDLTFGISYSDDINKAFKIIEDILKDDERLITTKEKTPQIFVASLGDYAVNITARIWVKTTDALQIQWDLRKVVKEAFDKGNITIPFPTQANLNLEPAEPTKKAAKAS
jgi:small conductance mechanosensitive channel